MKFILNICKRSEIEAEKFEVSSLGEIYFLLEEFESNWNIRYERIFEEDMNEAISDRGFDIFEDDFSLHNFKIEDFEREVDESLRRIQEVRGFEDIIIYVEEVK